MIIQKFLILLALTLVFLTPAEAAEDALSPEQERAVENIVEQYINDNPEILLKALDNFRKREAQNKRASAGATIARLSGDLNTNPGSPVIGNPEGDVTIVEFFDYQCGYCKRVFPTIQTLLKNDTNIRYVLKEFPILGPVSDVAARAALAVWNMEPSKYMPFHAAMMGSTGKLSEPRIFTMAEDVGIDIASLRQEMINPAVDAEIRKNMALTRELNITGTPSFVIGEHLVPGAVDMDTLQQLVAAARKG